MRLFIAIWLAEETKRALVSLQEQVVEKFPEGRKLPADNLHLTLKFLGERPEDSLPELASCLEEVSRKFAPFVLEAKGAGVFPEKREVRLFWVGADGKGIPGAIYRNLEDLLENQGIKREGRFQEHITIVRFRRPPARGEIEKFVRQWEEKTFGKSPVTSLSLVESRLTPEGPVYTTLKNFTLTGKISTFASPGGKHGQG